MVEVQVRTALQHLWAELSEKFSNVSHPDLKYGGGPEEPLRLLTAISDAVAKSEAFRLSLAQFEAKFAQRPKELDQELEELWRDVAQAEETLNGMLNWAISRISKLKGKRR